MITDLSAILHNTPDLSWLDDIKCAELSPDDYFVPAGHSIQPAPQAACRLCPVREQCLAHTYEDEEGVRDRSGYFAGMSPGQRERSSFTEALEFIRSDKPQPGDQQIFDDYLQEIRTNAEMRHTPALPEPSHRTNQKRQIVGKATID